MKVDQSYQKKDIELTHPSTELSNDKKKKEELQIDGLYPVKKDTLMYSDKDEDTSFDKLEEDSLVKIVMEEEDGFVFIDYNGNMAYIKTEKIKKNKKSH
ncbi:MAG: hypothetical protein SOW41_08550 [Anaerococcus sp.]|nr:hypothetical protein [Peptoniphilaceae bacterium]MDY3056087.1 hypothetical protein [Anaerococcus sp.]